MLQSSVRTAENSSGSISFSAVAGADPPSPSDRSNHRPATAVRALVPTLCPDMSSSGDTRFDWVRRPEFLYSMGLFVAALVLVPIAIRAEGGFAAGSSPAAALFFVAYGLLTIAAGYRHPRVGYVSFDRVSQVASILVLGPVTAAWVTGLASLIFPWRGLWQGAPIRRVVTASLNNAGLMSLMVLLCGSAYVRLGGPTPLEYLDLRTAALLALLIASLQVANQIGLGIHLRLRDGTSVARFSRFAVAMETMAGLTAIFVAIVFNRMEAPIVGLMLVVISVGMLMLSQFARMRVKLEAIVAERTRVLQEKTVELEDLASRDQLTGLSNRRHADQYLERCIDEHHRYGRAFSIALIDLDHFKSINDRHSHEIGDEVLMRVARVFAARCRDTDLVARYGGEEFLIGFPEADREAVLRISEELRRAIAFADWSDLSPDIRVSFSAGVAEMRPGLDRSSLVGLADTKLYEAKKAGRNVVMG
jgi:diguanylate cyclase (GGDEF)-like protein